MAVARRLALPDLLTLPLRCGVCGQLFNVEIERWSLGFQDATVQAWHCPECQHPNLMKFDGIILDVTAYRQSAGRTG